MAARKIPLAAYAYPTALAVSVLANLAGVFYFRTLAAADRPLAPQEIPLGDYRFVAEDCGPGQIQQAQFALHVELIRQSERAARGLIEARRQKLRQNLEELLRTAHSADFSDPALRELKGQFLKRINETLEIRAVAEIIVTDLKLERAQSRALGERAADKSVPWGESATE
ncbi:MAG: hypothetical protein ACYC6Y_07670 [Thermoguttaceae bacterium]